MSKNNNSARFARVFYMLIHFFAVLCKQQREMIKINGLWRTSLHDDKHFVLSPNLNAVHISFVLANCHVFHKSRNNREVITITRISV